MRATGCLTALPLFLLSCRPALAIGADDHSLLNSSLRMIWGLLVVLAILMIIYMLLKRRMSTLHGGGKGMIKIVETRHLMPKKSLFLVEVRGQEFLLAAGSDSLELIARIDPGRTGRSFDELLQERRGEQSS